MNKEVIYIEGSNALVLDENNKESIREYSNNLENILVQENVIEEIEKEIKEYDEIQEVTFRECSLFSKITCCAIMFLSPFLIISILDCLLRGNAFNLLFAFNSLNDTILCSLLSIVFGTSASLYFVFADPKQVQRGCQSTIE